MIPHMMDQFRQSQTGAVEARPNYSNGLWHGWNGGECPVHPRTVVEIATSGARGGTGEDYASQFKWNEPDWRGNPIVAFRVVKEYRQPRELWVNVYPESLGAAYDTREEAEKLRGSDGVSTLFREVLAEDAE